MIEKCTSVSSSANQNFFFRLHRWIDILMKAKEFLQRNSLYWLHKSRTFAEVVGLIKFLPPNGIEPLSLYHLCSLVLGNQQCLNPPPSHLPPLSNMFFPSSRFAILPSFFSFKVSMLFPFSALFLIPTISQIYRRLPLLLVGIISSFILNLDGVY